MRALGTCSGVLSAAHVSARDKSSCAERFDVPPWTQAPIDPAPSRQMNESQRPGAGLSARTDSAASRTPRLQTAPLFRSLLYTLVAPVGLAFMLDLLAGTLPWITLVVALICIPLASLIVGKAVLRDFERVLAVVAPPEEPPAAPEEGEHGGMPASSGG